MSSLHDYALNNLIKMMNSMSSVNKVKSTFHGQMKQVNKLLSNDTTAIVSPILNFQIKTANVPLSFNANKSGLNKLFLDWQRDINKDLNIDIPKGLMWIGEQYYRERWKSSLIAIKIRWGNYNGYKMPVNIWIMDGDSIYVSNKSGSLDTNEYYFGHPNKGNVLKNTEDETVFIRKPYSQGYDQYPSPYLVQRGVLEYAIFKDMIINKQKEMTASAFPYYLSLIIGDPKYQSQMPNDEALQKMTDAFKKKKAEYDTHSYSKGLIGSHPGDFKMEEFIPDFHKILDEKITKGIDKSLLCGLGLIELKGFSTTREEAILNPKVMVEEVEDAVLDYVDIWKDIVDLIREKNSNKYTANDKVSVQPGVIKAFLTDNMKTLIRSWYDRGLVGDKSALENTTGLLFETQVKERKNEKALGLDKVMYPRVIQNMEKDSADLTPETENVPDDKKGPEANNYKNATETYKCECLNCGNIQSSSKHCKDIKCSKCGGEMRRKDRPSTVASCWVTCSDCNTVFDSMSYLNGSSFVKCPTCGNDINID